jgi:hypothetical protein
VQAAETEQSRLTGRVAHLEAASESFTALRRDLEASLKGALQEGSEKAAAVRGLQEEVGQLEGRVRRGEEERGSMQKRLAEVSGVCACGVESWSSWGGVSGCDVACVFVEWSVCLWSGVCVCGVDLNVC